MIAYMGNKFVLEIILKDKKSQQMPSSPEFQTAYSKRTSRRRERRIVGGGAAFGENKKTLSDSDMTNSPKNPTESIDRFSLWAYSSVSSLLQEAADELKEV